MTTPRTPRVIYADIKAIVATPDPRSDEFATHGAWLDAIAERWYRVADLWREMYRARYNAKGCPAWEGDAYWQTYAHYANRADDWRKRAESWHERYDET